MKYGMSMIENLKMIQEEGIRRFIQIEKERWILTGPMHLEPTQHKIKRYGLEKQI